MHGTAQVHQYLMCDTEHTMCLLYLKTDTLFLQKESMEAEIKNKRMEQTKT